MLNIIHYIVQALVCVVEIVGIIGGIIALTRGKKMLGGFAIVGFLFLGLNLAVNFFMEQFRLFAARNFINTLWVTPCVAAPLAFLGVVCLVIAVFSSASSKKVETEEPPSE